MRAKGEGEKVEKGRKASFHAFSTFSPKEMNLLEIARRALDVSGPYECPSQPVPRAILPNAPLALSEATGRRLAVLYAELDPVERRRLDLEAEGGDGLARLVLDALAMADEATGTVHESGEGRRCDARPGEAEVAF